MILFRADANELIGAGHIMRCLSIAQAFRDRGENVLFVTADRRGTELICSRGFEFHCLDSVWDNMDDEVGKLLPFLDAVNASLMLVDSYYVTESYFKRISSAIKVAYIDDLNKCRWDVDYLINYNIYSTTYDYSCYLHTRTKLILGLEYVPLRGEFRGLSEHSMKSTAKSVFISAGGSDPEQISLKMAQYVCPCFLQVSFHLVVGALNPRIDELVKRAEESSNIILHIDERHISDLMMACDLAVSAAGSTLYELCACGTPTIIYTLADNQLAAAEEFERRGLMINAGDCRNREGFTDHLEFLIENLLDDSDKRYSMSKNMQSLVDGDGAIRLTSALL